MNIIKLLLSLMLILGCNSSSISISQTSQTPTDIIDTFFEKYRLKGMESALQYIFSTNKWMENNQNEINELNNKFIILTNQLGSYQGFNLIVRKSIGENYNLWSYMVKYDRQPIRFLFIFYKSNNIWQLQNFMYDDKFESEIIEAASIYRLDENLPGNEK